MRRRILIPVILLVAAGGGFAWWWFGARQTQDEGLTLYGNVELRQVEIAFNDSGRIAEVLVEEGDEVAKGDVLARLDTARLKPQVAGAKAQVAAQEAALRKLRNGSRPEEIAQARANVKMAEADLNNARRQYQRLSSLAESTGGRAVTSERELDAARTAMESAEARLAANQQVLALAVAGPRKEDIDRAAAQLDASRAELALLEQQLADAELIAPTDGVVRSRLMEPGEMASPQRPVFSLAVTDPKWVRAYVSEPDLVNVKPGMTATVVVDGLPDHGFTGRIGFISPVAEFTPRSVQTEELRTSLVYEVRVNVEDEGNHLRLGMPATVHLPLASGGMPVAASQPEQRR